MEALKGFLQRILLLKNLLIEQDLELFCWEEGSAEVEFLREVEGKVVPIEVKSGWITRSKSLKTFNEKYHPDTRVILSGKPLEDQ